MSYTTIQIEKSTREKLAELKEYGRETYDETLQKLIKVFEIVKDSEGELTEETKKEIEAARRSLRAGKGMSTKELLKRLGD